MHADFAIKYERLDELIRKSQPGISRPARLKSFAPRQTYRIEKRIRSLMLRTNSIVP